MFRIAIAVLAAMALVGLALPALGQQEEEPAQIYQRVTTYNVTDGDTIDADVTVPKMTVVELNREIRQGSLIRLRENYTRRVLASAKKL